MITSAIGVTLISAICPPFLPTAIPIGSAPWLDAGETLSSFTLNLSAVVRRTTGNCQWYSGGQCVPYPGYGPVQYNFVIQRGA